MKKCCTCKEFKAEIEFNKRNKSKDGLNNQCKLCMKVYSQTPNGKESQRKRNKKYRQSEKGKEASIKNGKKHNKNNPLKFNARWKLRQAVARGKIIKPKFCSICKKESKMIHGHHEDYDKPLEVIWRCSFCHLALHKAKKIIDKDKFDWTLSEIKTNLYVGMDMNIHKYNRNTLLCSTE